MRKIIFLLGIVLILGIAQSALAQAPGTILYQGKLNNADGAPMTAADVDSVRFAIGTAPEGISMLLWDTTVTDLDIDDNGIFTVELGPFPANVFNGSKRYLGITVNNDTEMTPRQALTSAPYAMAANPPTPGIAYNYQNTNATLSTSATIVDSIMISVPAAGYIVVQAVGDIEFNAATTTDIGSNTCLSKTTSFDYDNQCYIHYGSNPADMYYQQFSTMLSDNVVSAGTYKYYLLSFKYNSTPTAIVYRSRIVATYYPNAYGTAEDVTKSATNETPETVETPTND